MKLLAVAVLAVVLMLSSAQDAFAFGVSIDPTCGPPGTNVTILVFSTGLQDLNFDTPQAFLQDYSETQVIPPDTVKVTATVSNVESGLYTLIVTIAMTGESVSTTYYVGQCPVVGGIVTPANNSAIIAPWLAVIGLVGCIGTAVVVVRKRRP